MTTSNLPPLRHLPNWSRIGSLDRARYPRAFPRDCGLKAVETLAYTHEATQAARAPVDQTRVACLEKDILFLQQSHKNTLEKLHEEIECLKRTNKELQYQLIMESHNPSPKGPNAGNLREKSSQTGVNSLAEKFEVSSQGMCGAIITSLLPLKIHSGQTRLPRTPTLQECELIIQQLYRINALQSQELLQMKGILHNIVLNKKVTPEVYTHTKEYLVNTNSRGDVEHLPKLPLKTMPKTQQITPASMRGKVILPAIGKNMNDSMTARQKRAQDVHRTRLRRAINS